MPSPFLFALGFGNPLLLWGLGAASLPIILHLLNRRRFREERWAAMRFLLAAIRKNQRRIRIEQWLLLAVRTLIVVLVVAAMAKPFLESLGAIPLLPGQRTHRVIVLDGSLSMAYASAEVSRFEQAKTLAARLVKDARRGDAFSLVVMADPPKVTIGDPSANHEEVLKEVAEVAPTHEGTDLTATFEKVVEILATSAIPQKEVVFLTDLQAASWRKGGAPDDGLKGALAKLAERKPRSVVIDLGADGGENRAVTDLRLNTPIVTTNGPPPAVTATLRNLGRNAAAGIRARLLIDGQLGPEQTVDLPPGEDVQVAFVHGFDSPGDHVLEVQIDDDPLKIDNTRRLAVPVREVLRVLLVDGDYKPEAFAAETDYLAQALSPSEGTDQTPSLIKADVVAESQLARRDLSAYDAVMLCNLAQFTDVEVAALDAFLKQGGGLVVFGGERVNAENYNRLLFADGKGLLPAEVGPPVGDVEKKEDSSFEFDPLDFRHPIVEEFADTPDAVMAGLTGVKTWRFHKLKLPKGSAAQVALAFENGDPAVIELPRHRGRVIQVATSADAGWTSWPLHPSYPPVMERVALEAAAGRLAERNVRVGQPLEQSLPPAGTEAPATVLGPSGEVLPTKLLPAEDVSLLHFEDTELSGVYRVKVGPPLAIEAAFAANPDPAESDMAKLDRAGLAAAVPGWTFAYLDNWQNLSQDAASVGRRGELHRQLLYGVLALLIVESVLAWMFGHHKT